MFKLFTIILSFSLAHAQIGSPCFRRFDNAKGVCKSYYECPQARIDFDRGIPVTRCTSSQGSSIHIICCTGARISEAKCQQYSKLTKQVTTFGGLNFGSSSINRQDVSSYDCVLSTSLIVGGEKAKAGEFPHMAALGYPVGGIKFLCGGSLISERYILTAAHCSSSNRIAPTIARLGDLNLQSKTDGVREVDYSIERFIVHEQYDARRKKNDIAVVRLRSNVVFQNNIRPACLWSNFNVNARKAIATGFGRTGFADELSDELLKVSLDVMENRVCHDIYSRDDITTVDNSQLCAGSQGGNMDTCDGDSGGPLQITSGSNKCVHYIIGITSFGSSYCGYEPAVYTRVSSFIDWIERKVWT